MNNDLLLLLEKNSRLSSADLAAMLECSEADVKKQITEYEKKSVIKGYSTIIDWEKTDREFVSARIEVKVKPKKDKGFEELAQQLAQYDEVQSLYLMSGGYDFALTITGKSFKDIAHFVAYTLAPMDSVLSTSTHFVLQKYKDKNVLVQAKHLDERGVVL